MKMACALCVALCMASILHAGGKKDAAAQSSVVKKGNTVQYALGKAKLVLFGESGAFQLYAVGREGETAVFSGTDRFTSTYFSLLAGKNEYRLASASGVSAKAYADDGGVRMAYSISHVADVAVDFSIIKSVPENEADMLKVKIVVTNRMRKQNAFALKGVFDTVLGETTGVHFSTANTKLINSEMQRFDIEKERWVLSRNEACGVQFLLYGGDITRPETLTLGNKDVVSLPLWTPVVVQSRKFDSVMSYNNSAVAINWPSVELEADETAKIIFYIALASDGEDIHGESYINSFAGSVQGSQHAASDNVPDWKLQSDYIQMLLDRIAAFGDDDDISSDELARLNKELDEILTTLRRQ